MSEVTPVITGENSFSKMIKARIIEARQTGMWIQSKNIHAKLRADGSSWNRRDMMSPKTLANIEKIGAHLMSGGQVPAIEVQVRPEGGVQKVDGYCRHEAWDMADASGQGDIWINIVPFKGTELDALGRISTSNQDEKLSPLEQLDLYKSVREQLTAEGNEKPSLQDIADVVKVSRQYVDSILKLDALDAEGKAMVESGKVTVAIAVKAVRADAEDATAMLREAAARAEANGKKKATATTIKEPSVSTSLLLDIHQIGFNLRSNIDKQVAATAEQFLRGDIKGDTPVTVQVRDIAMMIAAITEGERQVADAKARQAAKADKAKRLPIPEQVEQRKDILDEQEEEEEQLSHALPHEEPELPETDEEPNFSFLG